MERIFKFKGSEYHFHDMIMYASNGGFYRLKEVTMASGKTLCRIGNRSFIPQSEAVNEAYLDYVAEKVLLGDDD